MVDKVEVTLTDLEKKHKGTSRLEDKYSVAKHVYMGNGMVDTIGFAIDTDILKILRAKIDAMLIDEDNQTKRKNQVNKISLIYFCQLNNRH